MLLTESLIRTMLRDFISVPFCLDFEGHQEMLGEGAPYFTVHIQKDISAKALMESTSLALGEAYMRGDITVDGDLYEVLCLLLKNIDRFMTDQKGLRRILFPSESKSNQMKQVSSHYDIGNDFYEKWLDETMSYSCAYFGKDTDSLFQAQETKVDRILKKLYLRPGMRLLDIGCGWGYLLIRAAKEYGVKGCGITLSREQKALFEEKIRKENLEDQLSVKLMDYRDLKKSGLKFDRAVSVGMLEHVGRDFYGLFLDCVKDVLKDGGLFLLHFISALKEFPGDAWIKKYIFPGGVVPSLREILHEMGEKNLYTLDVESLRRHYEKTLL